MTVQRRNMKEPINHVYDKSNHVLAYNLSDEELQEELKNIKQEYEVVHLEPPNYTEASY